ncbi:MAG: ABC transporter permease [Microbacterium sp.]|uniref:ABC transporter permease n=1 Tax=Microbacterium sp. TaxID=51671 RepID=UPI003F9BABCA
MSSNPRIGQEHFVAPVEETPLEAVDAIHVDAKPRTTWSDAWGSMGRRPMFWISSALILIVLIVALFPGMFTSQSPTAQCLLANSDGGPESGHPFGFTRQGCDVFARVLYGAQSSVLVGFLATALVVLVGAILGSVAGYYGGTIDTVFSRVADIFFAIPTILGAIVLMSMVEQRTAVLVALVIALFAWPQVFRIMRGAVIAARQSEYVMASIALGLSRFRILLRHVFPNAIAPVIAVATVSLGTYIVAEATLSFLGVGLPPSVMSWGNDISQARTSLLTNPMVMVYPSIALSLTVLSFLMLGDVLRDALDPKERARR